MDEARLRETRRKTEIVETMIELGCVLTELETDQDRVLYIEQ